ncbi:MAG: monofunctional biosynthetic peptidoglycan transglycosylase [Bacteroidales bacterium]
MTKLFRLIKIIVVTFLLSSILSVIILRFVPVYFTPLMIIRSVQQITDGEPLILKHKWVPIEEISHNLVQAVVASEDNLFIEHDGVDLDAIKSAIEYNNKGKKMRGGSTISQQTAKNVWLWPGRNWIRKGLELYFTMLMEFFWSKERIMEVYLNSIEMGNGIYGAEAVAKANFKKTASKLSKSEAATIAATLPNPRKFNSAKPSPYIVKRRDKIMRLMDLIGPVEL